MPSNRSAAPSPRRIARAVRPLPLVVAAALACAGAVAGTPACTEAPRCAPEALREGGRAAWQAGPRPDAVDRSPGGPARPAPAATRDPGTSFDRDGRFQGRLGGAHPFDERIDAGRGGSIGR